MHPEGRTRGKRHRDRTSGRDGHRRSLCPTRTSTLTHRLIPGQHPVDIHRPDPLTSGDPRQSPSRHHVSLHGWSPTGIQGRGTRRSRGGEVHRDGRKETPDARRLRELERPGGPRPGPRPSSNLRPLGRGPTRPFLRVGTTDVHIPLHPSQTVGPTIHQTPVVWHGTSKINPPRLRNGTFRGPTPRPQPHPKWSWTKDIRLQRKGPRRSEFGRHRPVGLSHPVGSPLPSGPSVCGDRGLSEHWYVL